MREAADSERERDKWVDRFKRIIEISRHLSLKSLPSGLSSNGTKMTTNSNPSKAVTRDVYEYVTVRERTVSSYENKLEDSMYSEVSREYSEAAPTTPPKSTGTGSDKGSKSSSPRPNVPPPKPPTSPPKLHESSASHDSPPKLQDTAVSHQKRQAPTPPISTARTRNVQHTQTPQQATFPERTSPRAPQSLSSPVGSPTQGMPPKPPVSPNKPKLPPKPRNVSTSSSGTVSETDMVASSPSGQAGEEEQVSDKYANIRRKSSAGRRNTCLSKPSDTGYESNYTSSATSDYCSNKVSIRNTLSTAEDEVLDTAAAMEADQRQAEDILSALKKEFPPIPDIPYSSSDVDRSAVDSLQRLLAGDSPRKADICDETSYGTLGLVEEEDDVFTTF